MQGVPARILKGSLQGPLVCAYSFRDHAETLLSLFRQGHDNNYPPDQCEGLRHFVVSRHVEQVNTLIVLLVCREVRKWIKYS